MLVPPIPPILQTYSRFKTGRWVSNTATKELEENFLNYKVYPRSSNERYKQFRKNVI